MPRPPPAAGFHPPVQEEKNMSTPFQHAVVELCQSLSLPPPDQMDDSLFTLQVGEHAVHLSEQPARQLLMFCCLSPQQAQADASPLRQNLFSDDPLKPVIGQSAHSQDWVLWNRQPLAHCDAAALQRQLERISDCAERCCRAPEPTASAFAPQALRQRHARLHC